MASLDLWGPEVEVVPQKPARLSGLRLVAVIALVFGLGLAVILWLLYRLGIFGPVAVSIS